MRDLRAVARPRRELPALRRHRAKRESRTARRSVLPQLRHARDGALPCLADRDGTREPARTSPSTATGAAERDGSSRPCRCTRRSSRRTACRRPPAASRPSGCRRPTASCTTTCRRRPARRSSRLPRRRSLTASGTTGAARRWSQAESWMSSQRARVRVVVVVVEVEDELRERHARGRIRIQHVLGRVARMPRVGERAERVVRGGARVRRAGGQRAERVQSSCASIASVGTSGQPASHMIANDGPDEKSPAPVPQTSVSTVGPS